MKKITILLLVFVMLFAGCSKKEEVAEISEPVEEITEPTLPPETNTRPIAVMIDNDNKDARPHAGVEDAYLIYEMYVEGSATRMMALFKDVNTEKIGPVRSSRHYFLDYALENDAIYVHYGWSPKASQDISAYKVNNINGVMGSDGNIFWRDRKYKNDWHSAYTSIENIMEYSNNTKKYRNTSDVHNFAKNATDVVYGTEDATNIFIPYAPFYKVTYTYDETEKVYKRYINGEGHITQGGVLLSAKNIILQKAKNFTIAGDTSGRQDITTTGSGEGYMITCGKMQKITWSKSDRTKKTVYTLENGEEIALNQGQTWIQIVPPSLEITFN